MSRMGVEGAEFGHRYLNEKKEENELVNRKGRKRKQDLIDQRESDMSIGYCNIMQY